MGLRNFDITEDASIFLLGMVVLTIVFAVLLSRVSPGRKRSRRIDQRPTQRGGGEIID